MQIQRLGKDVLTDLRGVETRAKSLLDRLVKKAKDVSITAQKQAIKEAIAFLQKASPTDFDKKLLHAGCHPVPKGYKCTLDVPLKINPELLIETWGQRMSIEYVRAYIKQVGQMRVNIKHLITLSTDGTIYLDAKGNGRDGDVLRLLKEIEQLEAREEKV